MNIIYLYTLISILIVSLISLIGVILLFTKKKNLSKPLLFLISFSAGALLGDAFIHLIPESFESFNPLIVSFSILAGIIIFFILEKIIHWRHCHMPTSKEHIHPLGKMNLIGDSLHNFLDGIIIATSYIVSIPLGIATTIAVVLHEIPQEISNFGVLVYAGYSRKKALFLNFLISLTAIIGGIIGLLLSKYINSFATIMIAFTAGGFIYIGASDLIPELKKETSFKKTSIQILGIILGIALMALLIFLE